MARVTEEDGLCSPLMGSREHPRTLPVQKAGRDIRKACSELRGKYKLTPTEYLGILAGIMTDCLRGCLRLERHPDDSTIPADVE